MKWLGNYGDEDSRREVVAARLMLAWEVSYDHFAS